MKAILGGYFETALVRYVDAAIRPDRNVTGHPYYICVNRKVPKSYFDRAATFIALSERVIIPSLDWGLPPNGDGPPELDSRRLGIDLNGEDKFGGGEWDSDTTGFVDVLLDNHALSLESWVHASFVDFKPLNVPTGPTAHKQKEELKRQVAHHYLCRLFLQVRAAGESGALLVLSEPDLAILQEVGEFLVRTGLPTPFAFPDLTGQIVNGEDFNAGLMNFSPPDALALAAVKDDAVVKTYASRVAPLLKEASTPTGQAALLSAMQAAHDRAVAGHKAETIFEVAGWVVKPLHYVPVVGEALTLAEDIKDVIDAWAGRETAKEEWYLLGVKMMDVAIKDYLERKGNQL